MKSKKKYGIYALFVIGIICVFTPFNIGFPSVYIRAIGVCMSMLSLYLISAKLTSKESSDD